jgi:GNAT superfamily N-acetyltransferase
MTSQYRIRPANDEDARAALSLMSALGYEVRDPDAFDSVFRAVIGRSDAAVLIAAANSGRAIGLAAVSWRPQLRLSGTLVSLDELVVDPTTRGLGVGRGLLDEVKALAARVAGPEWTWRLQLETNRSRESYRRGFYVKNGFQEVDSALLRYPKEFARR